MGDPGELERLYGTQLRGPDEHPKFGRLDAELRGQGYRSSGPHNDWHTYTHPNHGHEQIQLNQKTLQHDFYPDSKLNNSWDHEGKGKGSQGFLQKFKNLTQAHAAKDYRKPEVVNNPKDLPYEPTQGYHHDPLSHEWPKYGGTHFREREPDHFRQGSRLLHQNMYQRSSGAGVFDKWRHMDDDDSFKSFTQGKGGDSFEEPQLDDYYRHEAPDGQTYHVHYKDLPRYLNWRNSQRA